MELGLAGSVVIVTGASKGIGSATVDLLVEEGARVVGAARDTTPLKDRGESVLPVTVDLRDAGSAERLAEKALDTFGQIDGLVNNVGALRFRQGFLDADDEDWKATFDLNFHSLVRVTKAVLPHMVERGEGSLVHVASEAARFPAPAIPDYAASKTALLSVSKTLTAEFSPLGVRSNVVAPGPTRTPLFDDPGGLAEKLAEGYGIDSPDEAVERFIREDRQLPSRRIGTPEDVARVITYLLSPLASQVTGAEWSVDGGALRQL
ncbi:SDR family NAD(P)-dependent oxidoreductase [Nocardiopsis quinghaiensis]|uniref:SDR family NAD(P)-dependent oxidoreductase n=1 Tax=Nocardiopsis quinghaiensis TaxID=464995 RepID=UPI001239ABB1|nr:SDR family oxidoreductase [Nocardiopsis quinghaiensis]